MTAHPPIPDGDPVPMYRDLGIARPSLADVPWGDMVLTVTVHVGEGEDGR